MSQWLCVVWGQKVVEPAGQFVGANREIEHTASLQRVSSHCQMLCRVARWFQWYGHRNDIRLRRPLYMRQRLRRIVAKTATRLRCA